ncbi:MAG: hypothetical protein P4K83_03065 [Terracidiphilus sp.]|nr:hypothetical protein [Terracidiphilus sp.]
MSASAKSVNLTSDQVARIRKELGAILEGIHFASSKRCSDFLELIVTQTLAGNYEVLSERFLGVQLFGRPVDYETATDSVVRVRATDVRHRLVRHYADHRSATGVTIHVAPGTYIPEFRWAASEESTDEQLQTSAPSSAQPPAQSDTWDAHMPSEPSSESAARIVGSRKDSAEEGSASSAESPADFQEDAGHSANQPRRRPGISQRVALLGSLFAGLVIVALASTCFTLWLDLRAAHQILYPWKNSPTIAEFWGPFLGDQKNTDFVMADASYSLVQALANKSFSLSEYLSHNYVNQLQDSDARMASALGKISNWGLGSPSEFELAQRILALDPAHQRIHLYSARKYMPDLIAHDNVILVGSRFGNPWAELFDNRTNFVFDPKDPNRILNRAPAKGEPASFEFSPSDAAGYCILAYLPAPDGNALLIQGSSGESTQAAGNFLLSESQMTEFKKMTGSAHFPYFELLLKTVWVKGTPISSSIVAYRIYSGRN